MKVFMDAKETNILTGKRHEILIDNLYGSVWIECNKICCDIFDRGKYEFGRKRIFYIVDEFLLNGFDFKLISFEGRFDLKRVEFGVFEYMDLLFGKDNQLIFTSEDFEDDCYINNPRIIWDSEKQILRITADSSVYRDFIQLTEDAFVEIYNNELVGVVFKTPNLDFGIDLKGVSLSQEGQAGSGTSR